LTRIIKPFLFIILFYLTIGCIGTKHLKEGEYLLYNQKITSAEKFDSEAIKRQLVQDHNSRIWFLPIAPYTYIYHKGLKNYDSAKYELKKLKITEKFEAKISKAEKENKINRLQRRLNKKVGKENKNLDEGNLFMRWGEPIIVYDSTQTEKSRKNLDVYMKSNGWFMANSTYEVKYEKKTATVNYSIEPGPRYSIDTVIYDIADSTVSSIILSTQHESLIKPGMPYSQDELSEERVRIDELLKDNGYFDFSRQYIRFSVDSTVGNQQVLVQIRILKPLNHDTHRSFSIDSVIFVVSSNESLTKKKESQFLYQGVTYSFLDRYYSEKVLSRRIYLKPGDIYSKKNTLKTQRELAGMDMFKFVNVNYDSSGNNFIANIFVMPLKRYQWTAEAGLTVTQAVPGPFASLSLKQRNVFNTLGILEISGSIGVEGVSAASNPNDVLASLEAGANISLTFPKFFLPISDAMKRNLGFFNPKSTIQTGLSFTDRPEYTRSNLSAANFYTWQPKLNQVNEFRFLEVALVKTNRLDPAYLERLEDLEKNGNNLINSFKPSFISNQRFTRSVNINSYGRRFNNSSFFSLLLEPGGTFTNLWAREFFAKDSLEIYAYVKIDSDYRKIFASTKRKAWAFRVRSGVAFPYGENGLLPYEKYFFSGGSISNRAWKPRRLGPGSYNHIEEGQVSYKFEQQGEIILESSLEFRQQIIGLLHWAAFVDAGNIWTIREDNSRPGSQFKLNRFYQEIAVGAGLGLRFDFSFLIMRFDVAAKVIDPARPLGKRFILSQGFNDAPFNNPKLTEPVVYTLSIGYPF
jgi:outer membrane protein assembly factor BamA